MQMEEIRNIERLHSFMNELQNECVVKANVEEFLRICLDIIYDGERITKRHPYFTKPTAQERIKFSEFLLLPFVKSKIDKIDEIGKLLEKEYELFNENGSTANLMDSHKLGPWTLPKIFSTCY